MQKKYNSLNGIRAYAAMAILAMHVLENSNYTQISHAFYVKIDALKWLVYLFMIVSGFSLCCGYYEKMLNNSISIVDFYKKRYKKILPFFCLLVLIACIVDFSPNSVVEAIADFTLAFALLPNASISVIGVGWFLGVVFLFYMLFPFYCFLMRSKKSAWFTFAVCVFYNLSEQLYFLDSRHVVEGYQKHTNFLFCSMFFCAGGLIYLYRETVIRFVSKMRYPYLLAVAAITIMSFHAWPQITSMAEPFVCLVVFSLWVLYAISVDSALLNNRLLKFIAGISMEIYLCHMFVYRVIEKLHSVYLFGQGYAAYAATVLVTLAGSIAVSILFQKGSKAWKRYVNTPGKGKEMLKETICDKREMNGKL
jgi:peptidoglycan/LPS O-acetylase OafA/YrhL